VQAEQSRPDDAHYGDCEAAATPASGLKRHNKFVVS
jgi:hypothetical protein